MVKLFRPFVSCGLPQSSKSAPLYAHHGTSQWCLLHLLPPNHAGTLVYIDIPLCWLLTLEAWVSRKAVKEFPVGAHRSPGWAGPGRSVCFTLASAPPGVVHTLFHRGRRGRGIPIRHPPPPPRGESSHLGPVLPPNLPLTVHFLPLPLPLPLWFLMHTYVPSRSPRTCTCAGSRAEVIVSRNKRYAENPEGWNPVTPLPFNRHKRASEGGGRREEDPYGMCYQGSPEGIVFRFLHFGGEHLWPLP